MIKSTAAYSAFRTFLAKPLFQICGCGLRENLCTLFLGTRRLHFASHWANLVMLFVKKHFPVFLIKDQQGIKILLLNLQGHDP
jgi:hypothetical protein